MTVETTNTSDGPFVANGVTTAFPFTFTPDDADGVQVTIDDVEVSSALYTVALNAGNEGGTVNFTAAPVSGSVMVLLNPSFEQQASWENSGPFLLKTIEQGFDNAAIRDIYLKAKVVEAKAIAIAVAAWQTVQTAVATLARVAVSRATLGGTGFVGVPVYLMEAGRRGWFTYEAGNYTAKITADTQQGIYIATPTDPTGAAGAWVRKVGSYVDPAWFGFSTTNSRAANDTAMAGMLATLVARAANSDGLYQGAERIRLGLGTFNLNSTIELTGATFILEGVDTGFPAGRGTKLTWPAGVTGIRTQRYNTTGAAATRAPGIGGDGAIIRNLSLFGAFAAAEAEAHGIHLRTRALIENVFISGFEGDGIYCNAIAGGAPEGNANNVRVVGGRIENCRNGIFIDGTDANIWDVHGIDLSNNRQWGVWDSSFLGNTFTAIHTANNGITAANTGVGIGASVVSNSGNRYQVISGQEAGASVNAPSGTTADNTWWEYLDVGGSGAGIPAWSNGMVCRAGGAAHTDNANARTQFFGCYAEGGQGTAQLVSPTCVWEGILAIAVSRSSTAMAVYGSFGTLTTKNAKFTDSLEAHGATLLIGPQSGAAASNLNVYFDSTNGFSTLKGRKYTLGGALVGDIGSILFGYGSGMYYDVSNAGWAHNFRINGNDVCNIDTNGFNLNNGKVVKVNNQQVVGGRGASLPVDATDLATAIALVNAIKARIKTTGGHGLVAD